MSLKNHRFSGGHHSGLFYSSSFHYVFCELNPPVVSEHATRRKSHLYDKLGSVKLSHCYVSGHQTWISIRLESSCAITPATC